MGKRKVVSELTIRAGGGGRWMLGSRKARELPVVQCKIYSDNMTTGTLFKQWYFKSDKSTFTELPNTIYMLKFTS